MQCFGRNRDESRQMHRGQDRGSLVWVVCVDLKEMGPNAHLESREK